MRDTRQYPAKLERKEDVEYSPSKRVHILAVEMPWYIWVELLEDMVYNIMVQESGGTQSQSRLFQFGGQLLDNFFCCVRFWIQKRKRVLHVLQL